jgi:hypothetical protein
MKNETPKFVYICFCVSVNNNASCQKFSLFELFDEMVSMATYDYQTSFKCPQKATKEEV